MPEVFYSSADLAKYIGVKPPTLSRYKLPEPDVIIGHSKHPTRGWRKQTIEEWNRNRPGSGRSKTK